MSLPKLQGQVKAQGGKKKKKKNKNKSQQKGKLS